MQIVVRRAATLSPAPAFVENAARGSFATGHWRRVQFGTSSRWAARYRRSMRICFVFVVLCMFAGSAFAQGVAKGKQALVDSKCLVCHLVGAEGNKKGPVLDGVGAKLTAEEIRQWITNAPEMAAKANSVRKPPMKAYPDLPKETVDALVAYVSSLKK